MYILIMSRQSTLPNQPAEAQTQAVQALALLRQSGMLRARELRAAGIADETLARLVRQGLVQRVARGLYQHAEAEISQTQSLEETVRLMPDGILCLTTALAHHGLTLQNPRHIWVALSPGSTVPRRGAAYRYVWFGGLSQTIGIAPIRFGSAMGRITNPVRTVLDCFRYRSEIGLDVALEGLRNLCRSGNAAPTEIARMARQLRIWSIVRPYLEALAVDD
jgi:predicted transcriptional regulator of viral defense system